MTSSKALIEIENVCKFYSLSSGEVHALKKIRLKVNRGESISVMGPSGSGKSTLLHLLGCLEHPTNGKYYFNQQEVSSLNDCELSLLRASKIGFVFQSFHLIPQLNIYQNIEIPFLYQPLSLSKEEIDFRVLKMVEKVRMSHRLYHLPSQLSGGEMQRVAIARALVTEPLLILADEPTGNLDSDTGDSILKVLQDFHHQGVTLIIVTHDKEVGKHCQRRVEMRDGQMIGD